MLHVKCILYIISITYIMLYVDKINTMYIANIM